MDNNPLQENKGKIKSSSEITRLMVKTLSLIQGPQFSIELPILWRFKKRERQKSIEEQKTELIKELLANDIDPELFDILLTNETNRKLKVHFGIVFLILTLVFTLLSYAIVVLNSIYSWNIPQIAITALIIEIPIQFIGLLYIVARNLFPTETPNKAIQRT